MQAKAKAAPEEAEAHAAKRAEEEAKGEAWSQSIEKDEANKNKEASDLQAKAKAGCAAKRVVRRDPGQVARGFLGFVSPRY